MLNNCKRGKIANCIALHDFANDRSDIKGWFEYIVEFFRKNGISPTRIGITGAAYPRSKSTILFKNGAKRLYEKNFDSVESIELSAWDLNEDTICIIWIRFKPRSTTLVLCVDNQIVPFDHNLMNLLAKDLAEFIGSKYGYCYQRDFDKGPEWYVFGTLQGIDAFEDPEAEQISKWSREYRRSDGDYKTGDLRDIYPMNVLCSTHLERSINGKPLKEWIEEDKSHGLLEQLDTNLWVWWVENDQISTVREALKPTGIILCV